ncbi:excisionase family DNA-binding protein [Calycomorphotria hydatis]|uniref:Helix-turn-helix domain-containing protein n=1 Tax=Calycomorphotria hydatis TaxID=2528027 RepID=A0A517T4A9_9PLAN|nr:excisionase family DNA-binding protein [Calycomorphotria hydatis]QDT63199.1 hypothetical protein V22_04170 [Calycomorphotria hydatis]
MIVTAQPGKQTHFSPKELAQAIAASESSVKRWIDDGKLNAVKTAGGHRRIPVTDAFRFIRQNGHQLVNPSAFGMTGLDDIDFSDAKAVRAKYLEALETGDEPTTTGIVTQLHLLDHPIASIADDPVHWAFRDMRSRCTHPSEECVVLHRGQSNSIHGMQRLRDLLPELSGDAPKALLADLGYEIDGLPTFLAETVLTQEGYRCVQLGLSVPDEVITGAITRVKPRLLWISAHGGAQANKSAVSSIVHRCHKIAAEFDTQIIVMGDVLPSSREFGERPPRKVETMKELAAFAAGVTRG